MTNAWIHWVTSIEGALLTALFLAFLGAVAWRNRHNKFLFIGWLSVLAVFVLSYATLLLLGLRTSE